MITALATVTAVKPHSAGFEIELSCQQQTSCSGCASQKSCGTGIVAKAVGNKALHWQLVTPKAVQIGQLVEIGLAQKSLFRSAAVVYLLPLLAMILGAFAAHGVIAPLLGFGEGLVILITALATFGGLLVAKQLAAKWERQASSQVMLLRVLGEPIS